MSLQQQYIRLLEHFDNIPGKLNVFFEAHYWGRFRLLTNSVEAFPDPQGYLPIAQIQSPPYDTWLLLDPEKNGIILRESDAQEHRLIAFSLEEFFGSESHLKQVVSSGESPFVFDQRPKMEDLLSPEDYLITAINDPEHFEELSAYYELFDLLAQLTRGDLRFDQISGEEAGIKKTFTLQKGTQQWQIHTSRELFDNAFIHQLNQILIALNIITYSLSTSINEQMQMVLLKLTPDDFQALERKGLLI